MCSCCPYRHFRVHADIAVPRGDLEDLGVEPGPKVVFGVANDSRIGSVRYTMFVRKFELLVEEDRCFLVPLGRARMGKRLHSSTSFLPLMMC